MTPIDVNIFKNLNGLSHLLLHITLSASVFQDRCIQTWRTGTLLVMLSVRLPLNTLRCCICSSCVELNTTKSLGTGLFLFPCSYILWKIIISKVKLTKVSSQPVSSCSCDRWDTDSSSVFSWSDTCYRSFSFCSISRCDADSSFSDSFL